MEPYKLCPAPHPRPIRRDGWTVRRQLVFIKLLERTRSVTAAARAVGMSRESAHRFRGRAAGSLFALLWDHAVGRTPIGTPSSAAVPPGIVRHTPREHAPREVDQGHTSARPSSSPSPAHASPQTHAARSTA